MDVVHSVEYRPRSTDLSPGCPLLCGAYNATEVTWGRSTSLAAAYAFASRTCLGDWGAPVPPEAIEILEIQKQAFRNNFGRDPGDGDPVFFDPAHDTPRPMDEGQFDAGLREAMKASGTSAAVMYAYKKTGRIVTKANEHLLPP